MSVFSVTLISRLSSFPVLEILLHQASRPKPNGDVLIVRILGVKLYSIRVRAPVIVKNISS